MPREGADVSVYLDEIFDEFVQYGMPFYPRDGVVEVAFANQKQHISLYIPHRRYGHAPPRSGAPDRGQRMHPRPNPEQIDMTVVRSMLAATAQLKGKCLLTRLKLVNHLQSSTLALRLAP